MNSPAEEAKKLFAPAVAACSRTRYVLPLTLDSAPFSSQLRTRARRLDETRENLGCEFKFARGCDWIIGELIPWNDCSSKFRLRTCVCFSSFFAGVEKIRVEGENRRVSDKRTKKLLGIKLRCFERLALG